MSGNYMTSFTTKLYDSLKRLERWVEGHGYRGYEPFDGLSSPLQALTFDNLFLERLLQQAVRWSPVNIRPLIGVTQKESTKGRGFMAAGYLAMHRVTGDPDYLKKAELCLDWLDRHKAEGYAGHSWGNYFPFSSRTGRLPADEPIIVWTSLIGQTFLDAYEQTGQPRSLAVVRSACDWILALPRERTSAGSCLSYVAYTQESIHNSNMLGAALLARASGYLSDTRLVPAAREAMLYSCSRQRPDGSWWYGEAPDLHWIDNYHTAYNLDSLKCYIEATGDSVYRDHLKKGFAFFKERFFLPDGTPRYYHDRTYPIDSQCMSQAVETLAKFAGDDPEALPLAVRVADWAIDAMQDRKSGHFYFRRYRTGLVDRTPMLHWAQATMYKGLALLFARLAGPRSGRGAAE
ncbi:MAG: hypothetical protein ABFD52_02195 [Acidobacteriota bacterium]